MQAERQPKPLGDALAGFEPFATHWSGHDGELLVEPIERRMLAGKIEPQMRKARTRPVAGGVVARIERPRYRAIRDHGALLIAEAERLAAAVDVIVHVIDPERHLVRIARARRFRKQRKPKRVAETEVRVRLRDRVALPSVGIEQPVRGPSLEDEGEFPRQVVRILNAGVEAKSASRRKTMRRIADDEQAIAPELHRHLPAHPPYRAIDQLHGKRGHTGLAPDELDHFRIAPRLLPIILHPAD